MSDPGPWRLLRIASKPLPGPMSAPDIPQGFEHLEEPPLGKTGDRGQVATVAQSSS